MKYGLRLVHYWDLVRNKKLLDYDNDLDFGCFFDSNKQKDLRENLLGLGFRKVSGYVDDKCVLDKFIYDGSRN